MADKTTGVENHAVDVHKQAFSIDTSRRDGLLLQIHHTISARNKKSKTFKFIETAFDDTGEQLAASDHVGNVVVIDFSCLRFWMLPSNHKCSVLKFSTYKKNELLIGRPDGNIDLVDTGSCVVNGHLIGHKEPVSHISFATGEPFCLTVSTVEAIIWNLQSNSKLHKLALYTNVSYRQILFIPVSNNIFACFNDNTVHIWKFKSFECVKYSLPYKWNNNTVSSISVTRDGQTMALGGSSTLIILMSLEAWTLKKYVQLPNYIKTIKHLEFLPQPFDGGSSKIIAVLTHSSNILLFDTDSTTLMASVDKKPNRLISKFTCSVNGKYLVTLSNAGELNVYNTFALKNFPSVSDTVESEPNRVEIERRKHVSGETISKKKQPKVDEMKNRESRLMKLNSKMETVLDSKRLKQILEEFLEYPESYRSLIWKTILRLPQNQFAYNALQKKGLHPACRQFNEDVYFTKNSYFTNSLKRLISCLSYWSPLFSQLSYLPNLISPFLKVFKSNNFTCFEFVATFIVNWCQRWFEFFPFPPVNIMSMVENILAEWDEELFNWFVEQQVTSHQYGWTILQSLFSQVLSHKEWMQLFDHVLSNEPSFLIFAVVAFLIVCRATLLRITSAKDFEFFFQNETAIDMRQFIKKTYQLYQRTEDDESHPRVYLRPFKPLEQGETYQIFNEYPKFVVDKQADHINNLKEELTDLLREQSRLARARAEQEKKQALEINRQAQRMQLLNLQKQYQEVLQEEENRIMEQTKKVKMLKRDLKQRELLLKEETRSRTQDLITQQRTAALQALILQIDKKRVEEERKLKDIEEETHERHQLLLREKQLLDEQLAFRAEAPIPIPPGHDELATQLAELTEQLMKIREENSDSNPSRDLEQLRKISTAEGLLQNAELELAQEAAERQKTMLSSQHNMQALKLEAETKALQSDVDLMVNNLVEKKLHESWDLIRAAKESRNDREGFNKELLQLNEAIRRTGKDSDGSSISSASGHVMHWEANDNHHPSSSYHPSSSSSINFNSNDLLVRSTDYYRKQQDAIKSSLNIRQRLLSQNQGSVMEPSTAKR